MKKLLLAFLLFPFLSIKGQHYSELTNAEKYTQIGTIDLYPVRIGSVFIYPGLLPVTSFTPSPNWDAFNLLLLTIQNMPFADQKAMIVSHFIETNDLFALQLLDLLSLISFDREKLELAKIAYPYIIDKQNFIIVVNALNFISSQKELIEHVQGRSQ